MSVASPVSSRTSPPAPVPRLLWRCGSLLLFAGCPAIMIMLVALTLSNGAEDAGNAARNEDNVKTIIERVGHIKTRPQDVSDTAQLYLSSRSEGLAQAELQNITASLVEAASGRLNEMQMGGEGAGASGGKVTAGLSFDITNRGLLDVLYAAETNLPLLTVTSLDMRPAANETDRLAGNGLLRVDLTIQAYWRKSAP